MSAASRPSWGFGLLEAVVALALLAGTGVALFAWVNQNLQQASRLRELEQQIRLTLTAQALIETVNPMEASTGRREVGALSVEWTATALQPERRNANFMQTEGGAWQVQLFALDVRAEDRTNGVQARFEQWRVGMRRRVQPAASLVP